jgi:adenylate cyclase
MLAFGHRDSGGKRAPPAMLKIRQPIMEPPVAGRDSARALFWRMVVLYLLGSLAAVIISLLLVFLGLELNGWQWAALMMGIPIGVSIYAAADIVAIRRHLRPIGPVLSALDRGERPDDERLAAALVQALNLPFLSFLRVTGLHGPLATILLCTVMYSANWLLDANYAHWQVLTFAATVMFFASPTHAIFEYFAVSRDIEPVIRRLGRAYGRQLPPPWQKRLISIRLKEKLLYLAIFVAALPLIFFAASVIFKIERLLMTRGLTVGLDDMMPLYLWIGGVILVCMLGALIMALLTANEVSRSAKRMLAAMGQVESGRLDEVQLDVISTDEYADLYRGFGLMVESLREEQQILEVSNDLAGELQLNLLIARIMSATTELLGAERSTLFLYDAKTDELYSFYAEGMETREIRIPASKGIAGAVFTSGKLENIADPYRDIRFGFEVDQRTGFKTESILCAPISNKAGGRIGVTQALNKKGGPFTAKDEARLRAFSAQIAVCLENAKLFDEVLNVKNYNESILRSTSNGIVTLDAENNIVTANDAALVLLAMEREALVGAPAARAFAGPNQWIADSLRRIRRSGETTLAVDAEIARDGQPPASVNLTATPLIDVADARIGSMLVLEDITSEKRVRSTMARYMSKEVADQLLAAGEEELGGKDQKVSILFSDVRGFTTISEALGARETVSMLNEYFTEMVDVIFDHGGILDKYIGDAIMALFGAPFPTAEDADNALAVANEMMLQLGHLNERRQAAGKKPIDIGVGISTGDVVVGNIGSNKRMEYTVIGDSVNLASRLEGATKHYGCKILLSEFTVRELQRPALLREIDLLRVKGKERPVAVYESLGYREGEMADALGPMLDSYGRGLAAYRERDWRSAIRAFNTALGLVPDDGPSAMYLERCRSYAASPPLGNWDGVWVMETK